MESKTHPPEGHSELQCTNKHSTYKDLILGSADHPLMKPIMCELCTKPPHYTEM